MAAPWRSSPTATDDHDRRVSTQIRHLGGEGRHLQGLLWHRSTGSHVPHESLSSGSRRLDTGCRPASRQASAGLGPKGRSRLWFRQHLEWLSTRHRRFTHVRLPDTHPTGSYPPFPSTLTTPDVILDQLVAVWTLILQSEPEGPALISCAARLLRSDSTLPNLLLAPSWRTDLAQFLQRVPARDPQTDPRGRVIDGSSGEAVADQWLPRPLLPRCLLGQAAASLTTQPWSATGGYSAVLLVCIALELGAAVVILGVRFANTSTA
jgi:hypothetical protein